MGHEEEGRHEAPCHEGSSASQGHEGHEEEGCHEAPCHEGSSASQGHEGDEEEGRHEGHEGHEGHEEEGSERYPGEGLQGTDEGETQCVAGHECNAEVCRSPSW